MPARPAASLLPPIGLDLLPDVLRRRGVAVSLKRVQEAAAAGALPGRRQGGRHVIDEADLDAIEAYFRAHPARPYRRGATANAGVKE